ncbi:(2Fe-2S)-binding protein [Peribacillus simplex]|uniref:Xanthine dehydrogenase subunit E n=1 Tax=Peribacillus simplex TaxID=1478 RepID=A0A9W4KZZ7_9BACI|nr:(2Fe-2S)-binding protein [Peribacillus simplex]MDR4927895.1 (2Fe-2S)-binding protein [Peribacillus simplex]WHX93106.1 (2Fe-2S)-binding protein [Peribacillus simplex]CAH0237959.1 putative xanthine dehydrogenase subunit E [Peribacillus simplex]
MIKFTLNRRTVETDAPATARLLDLLRGEFELIGTKEGCGEGECGACSVFVNNLLQNSCLIPIGSIAGADIQTIEGIIETEQFKILDESYSIAGGVQCGYCIPGMIMASAALLSENPHPSEAEIREGISGNLCRCTGYNMIVEAINLAAKKGDGL